MGTKAERCFLSNLPSFCRNTVLSNPLREQGEVHEKFDFKATEFKILPF